jgi:hypothetical protein
MIASLSGFISKSDVHIIPFYKLLCKADDFQWDDQAMIAFIELKQYLKSLPHRFHQSLMMCCYSVSQPPTQLSV